MGKGLAGIPFSSLGNGNFVGPMENGKGNRKGFFNIYLWKFKIKMAKKVFLVP